MDELTYVGHATTLIRLGGSAVLTDPLLRSRLGPLRRHGRSPDPSLATIPDLVLISHLHLDHLDVRSLRRLPATVPLIAPRGATKWARKGGAERIVELGRGEVVTIGELRITGVRASHDGFRGLIRRGSEIEPVGYVIEGAGRTVYFAGDTDLFDEMADLGSIDLALLPVWGWGTSIGEGHMDPARAAEAAARIRPQVAVPIHWGTLALMGLGRLRPELLTQPPLEFARLTRQLAPEVEVRILRPGESTRLGSR